MAGDGFFPADNSLLIRFFDGTFGDTILPYHIGALLIGINAWRGVITFKVSYVSAGFFDSCNTLLTHELAILDEIYSKVKPFMSQKGIATIEETGTYVTDFEGDYTTPCVDTNKECAYVVWENGITKCAIEKAYEQGVISWKKPISCHLYPIRITKYPEFDVLNYDRWSICSPACAFGNELKVRVHEFLKEPLIRKYGKEWYE